MIEKQAFEQIFRCHYDRMFRLARRMLGSDEESICFPNSKHHATSDTKAF